MDQATHNKIVSLIWGIALATLFEKFLSPEINLSPKPVLHGDGSVKHPAMDNHSMGTVFEELVRKFNEENNEEAGEHWTPRGMLTVAEETLRKMEREIALMRKYRTRLVADVVTGQLDVREAARNLPESEPDEGPDDGFRLCRDRRGRCVLLT